MVEPWVLELCLGNDNLDMNDPDRPWAGTVRKTPQSKIGLALQLFGLSNQDRACGSSSLSTLMIGHQEVMVTSNTGILC